MSAVRVIGCWALAVTLSAGMAWGQATRPAVRTDVEPKVMGADDVKDPRQIPVASGASIPDDLTFDLTVHVTPAGDDGNDGTSPERAMQTPYRAVDKAWRAKAEGRNARVRFAAGVYPSGIGGHRDAMSDAFLVIEGDPDGGTVFDGARRFTDWQVVQGLANTWEREWPHDWRVPAPPRGPAPPISRRREMVYVDGELLRLRLAEGDNGTHPSELNPGEFSISEETKTVRLRLPDGQDPNERTTDVSMQNVGGGMFNVNNLVLRNVTIRRSPAQGPSLFMRDVKNVRIERLIMERNATNGFGSQHLDDMTIRNSSFSHNASTGLWMHFARNVLVENTKFDGNNWRGHDGGYYVWGPCGFKFMHTRTLTIRDSQAVGNYATGMWVDVDAIDTRVENNVIVGNLTRGLHIEANQGAALVRHNLVAFNRRPTVANFWPFGSGIAISQQFNALVEENIVYGNDVAQIGVRSDFVARRFGRQGDAQDLYDFETLAPIDARTRYLALRRNVVVPTSAGVERRAFSMPGTDFDGGEFYKTFASAENLFWHPDGRFAARPMFRVGVVRFAGGEGGQTGAGNDPENQLNWSRWRSLSGQEENSQIADPMFVDPENGDFTIGPDSPVADWGLPDFRIDPAWVEASKTVMVRPGSE